jgi:hypothetical protein
LTWNGAAGGLWGAGGNWLGGGGQRPNGPQNGDDVVFDPGTKDTVSEDNIGGGLTLNTLTVKAGYTSNIKVDNSLKTTADADIEGGAFLKNQDAGVLEFGTSATNTSQFTLSSTSFTDLVVTLDPGTENTLTISGALTLSGSTLTANNADTNWSAGTITINNGAGIVNSSYWTIDTNADINANTTGSNQFVNKSSGTLDKGGGQGNTIHALFNNLGLLSVDTAGITFADHNVIQSLDTNPNPPPPKMTIASGASITVNTGFVLNIKAGLLEGAGTITGTVRIEGGTVAPGMGGAPGTLTITGNYSQDSSSELKIYISATGTVGLLSISGTSTLDGTLTMSRDAGYTPTSGSLTFMTYASVTGDFSTTIYSGFEWFVDGIPYRFAPSKNATSYQLVVEQGD